MTRSPPRHLAALFLVVLLSACGRLIPETRIPAPPVSTAPPAGLTSALLLGAAAGPSVASLGLAGDDAATALAAFRESCPRVTTRADQSGLTRPEDWKPACAAATTWPTGDAARFFATWLEPVRIGDGKAHATGYYEPEIAGVRTRRPGYDVPVFKLPPDLVRARPEDAPPTERGTQPLGRYDETGTFVPYYDRAAIEGGALAGKGLEIGWAADPVEFFFLQIQGSGRLIGPDGSVMRIGYAGQNGHPYTGIGSVMRARGLIGEGPGQYSGSMQGIMQYIRENPEAGRELMQQNQSWIFFKELTGDGPLGALNVPVRARSSVAADPAYVPLGAPVWLSLDRPEASGLWIAQDTGGAIKGANRFDTFWGAGSAARTTAGGMSGRGEAVLLLPKGTLQRLNAR
ncbi:membrane-bound lytic murein transglycosylase A [Novosphingobium kunmingense]|uniref:peptidoglycan lytic exotransglycosylase n=1 Tax=Novosphingobium kunmingense TaxID=1211806 RepID=A0A2N0H6T0_9SPHN|nr:murein transglycosylase A [Novosphingobium kunmingense]PKB14645.1 membrane-bound lytic murein transglycosylase A [Novosphingobium kunmingense]